MFTLPGSFSVVLLGSQLIAAPFPVADSAPQQTHPTSPASSLPGKATPPSPYRRWSHGPSTAADFFPLGVWLQSPANAARYRQAGFNTYIGLWKGPTEPQLAALKQAGMRVLCAQNEVALRHLDDPTIIGWLYGDEPDNAQSRGARLGWSSPVPPDQVVAECRRMQQADPSRPVQLNLGQGLAWDAWYGRGSRANHLEDYPHYLAGCDIASFDIYPANHDRAEVAGKLWYVARGVKRLIQWTDDKQVVWNCLECTHISSAGRKPTAQEVRAEAWMSLIHGSRGLIFFVHQFKPVFREAALLEDPEMLEAVTKLNHQIIQLAPVLNSPTLPASALGHPNFFQVTSNNPAIPIATMLKRHAQALYLFAVPLRDGTATATFHLASLTGGTNVEVLDEHRSLTVESGAFKDHFTSWEVHLYRVSNYPGFQFRG